MNRFGKIIYDLKAVHMMKSKCKLFFVKNNRSMKQMAKLIVINRKILKGDEKVLFISIVLSIPIYGLCIWSLYQPEESYFFFDRWRYKEIPELSDIQIKLIRIGSVVTMIVFTIYLIVVAIDTFRADT